MYGFSGLWIDQPNKLQTIGMGFCSYTTTLRSSSLVNAGDFDIFVEIDGTGPYMIMTHGLGANTNIFQPLTEIFCTTYTVVRIDWPGHGQSSLSKTGDKLTMPVLTDLLECVMDILEIQNAVLVGHSLGDIVSMMMAAKSPSRVRGLAVIGAGQTRAPPSAAKSLTLDLARQARELGCCSTVDARVALNIPPTSPSLSRALLRTVTANTDPEGYAQICEALCDDSHVDPDYTTIRCATSIIGGTDDAISPIAVTDSLVNAIGKGGVKPDRHLLNTGHMTIIEDVQGIAAAILSLLKRAYSS